MLKNAQEHGTAGDCLFCQMTTDDGQTLGEATQNTEHLRDHIEEKYYMATLTLTALKAKGYRDPVLIFHIAIGTGPCVGVL